MKQKILTLALGKIFLALTVLMYSSGCTSLIVNPLLDPLTLSLQKQTDLQLLQDGVPSLLLLLDGLIASDPDNERLLMTAAKAYGAYATVLYEEGQVERAVTVSSKAKEYGINLLKQLPGLQNINNNTLGEIDQSLGKISPGRVGSLFWGTYGWAIWIQYQEGAPAAMADLPIVEQIMLRVVELDESYYYGGAHIFLGAYYGSRPQMFGGNPEASRQHFERALALNDRLFLLTHVAYAETYARTMFDRELYLELLTEVIEQPLADSDMASSNKVAKVKAEKLIVQIDDFF
ncbi:MAG: TRAP transporter TatT component family protein [Desulfobacterales bacterium]|nr:TRAP transporter TatT component family protein [Desulfobacterales bacterium]